MNMKKLVALLLALVMVFALCACGGDKDNGGKDSAAYKVAMITDYGDITDQSFNQTTYEACKAFCTENNIEFTYYKPAGDSTPDRIAMVEKAVDEGYNVIVMPGYAFGGAIVEAAPEFPDVKFIALDVAAGDLLETAVANAGESYDNNPSNWDLNKYVDMSNVYCAVYQEELCGYMAGYAAVKLGYKNLGFLGGMAVPAVIRYGYGFVQGADAAAKEIGATDVNIKYWYSGGFAATDEVKNKMDGWYSEGTEVVFACGGPVCQSCDAAAQANGGKMIGVDVDQAGVINGYSGVEDMTVTSAMKGLAATVKTMLTETILNNNWDKFGGKVESLGLVSGDDPELNYVQIPMTSTQWADGKFTQADYKTLVKAMFDGTIKVSNDITAMPKTTTIKVEDLGNLK